MRVVIAYTFPNLRHDIYNPMARRFALQYTRFPPGETDHSLYVIVNGGGDVTPRQQALFEPLVPNFIHHSNIGRDIGGYQMISQKVPCDFLVCIGSPVRPACTGWLDILVHALENYGPGIYGLWAYHEPAVHIRTTCFAICPQLLNGYPVTVTDGYRYAFEHGPESITKWCFKKGFQVLQVTKRGVFSVEAWHHVERCDSLMLDQFTDSFGWQDDGSGW